MFHDQFMAAFREVARKTFTSAALAGSGDLGAQLREDAARLGYGTIASSPGSPIVLVSEDRHIPYLLRGRDAHALPLVQFAVAGDSIQLAVFGPVDDDRRSPYIQYDIDCSSIGQRPGGVAGDLSIGSVHRGVAVGVHSFEEFLRTDSLDHHRSMQLPDEARAVLEELVARNLGRVDLIEWLFAGIGPMVLFVGHDCYTQAIDTNVALSLHTPVVLMPKGKVCQAYAGDETPGAWSADGRVFISHLSHWLSREMARRWDALTPAALDHTAGDIERRLSTIPALKYANIGLVGEYLDPDISWKTFQEASGLPFDDADADQSGAPVRWIFALHSFSDEAFRWGMDQLPSLYGFFLLAARLITERFPSDLIVIRPHPHSVGLLSETILEKQRAGDTRALWARHFDALLQLHLCADLAATGARCRLSRLVPTGQILQPAHSVVVTRHGSMIPEAAWTGRVGIFSCVAPYAFLFPGECQYRDAASLEEAIVRGRARALGGAAESPTRDSLARYLTILETPFGFPRDGLPGGVVHPISTHEPMRNFDDLSYPSETVEGAADRLLACLKAPPERTAFATVLGRLA